MTPPRYTLSPNLALEFRDTATTTIADGEPDGEFSPWRSRRDSLTLLIVESGGMMKTLSEASLACVENTELFLHPLLEGEQGATSAADRRTLTRLRAHAGQLCGQCPMLNQCRYDAVAKFDVSGFVAATTATERRQIRRLLNINVAAEDLDSLSGAFTANRQVNSEDVIRLRNAYPDDTLERLAERLRCSLSTVKRHLRRARLQDFAADRRVVAAKPTVDQVARAAASLGESSRATAA